MARRAHTRRRRAALSACLLWLAGFELAPNLHLGLHAHLAPHVHHHDHGEASGPRVMVHFDALHQHADGTLHAHAEPDADARPALEALEVVAHAGLALLPYSPDPLGHGAHSLSHRGIVVAEPPPVAVAPAPIAPPLFTLTQPPLAAPRSHAPAALRARGPPPSARHA